MDSKDWKHIGSFQVHFAFWNKGYKGVPNSNTISTLSLKKINQLLVITIQQSMTLSIDLTTQIIIYTNIVISINIFAFSISAHKIEFGLCQRYPVHKYVAMLYATIEKNDY